MNEVTTKRVWAMNMARELVNQHGLPHWSCGWNNCKRFCGRCFHDRKTIELSRHFVDNNVEDEIRDTILHEIAHALVGPRQGHNLVWQGKCLELGCRPVRCALHAKMPGKWQATCSRCGVTHNKHRRPKASLNYHCKCSRLAPALTWETK